MTHIFYTYVYCIRIIKLLNKYVHTYVFVFYWFKFWIFVLNLVITNSISIFSWYNEFRCNELSIKRIFFSVPWNSLYRELTVLSMEILIERYKIQKFQKNFFMHLKIFNFKIAILLNILIFKIVIPSKNIKIEASYVFD